MDIFDGEINARTDSMMFPCILHNRITPLLYNQHDEEGSMEIPIIPHYAEINICRLKKIRPLSALSI